MSTSRLTPIRLTSDSNKNQFPDNRPTFFTNSLSPILEDVIEVGLASISVPLKTNYTAYSPVFINSDINNFSRVANLLSSTFNILFLPALKRTRISYAFESNFIFIPSSVTNLTDINIFISDIYGEEHKDIDQSRVVLLEILVKHGRRTSEGDFLSQFNFPPEQQRA